MRDRTSHEGRKGGAAMEKLEMLLTAHRDQARVEHEKESLRKNSFILKIRETEDPT